jgi:EAL domain-containing protein (putative c-di-GMP-specific phosphodiesterase class I)
MKLGFIGAGNMAGAIFKGLIISETVKPENILIIRNDKKLQEQQAEGLYLVPQSLNISRIDFESCDIVDEICRRIDAAGIPRDKLTIELTESAVGQDFEFMQAQVQRLQELGFKVWMDDFGSGYSSLDVLQDIHFDLIKLDMRFMHRFDEGPENRIIVTELVKMALALGVETVCEGVETREQAEFLREVGCTKLQGYYFCRPIPMEQILERYRKGVAIGFENPDEAEYFAAIGRINLYDLTAVSNDSSEKIANFFDTLPMAVVECDAEVFRTTRANNAYRSFALRNFHIADLTAPRRFDSLPVGLDSPFADAVQRCREEGMRLFFDGTLPNGSVVHSMARYVAQNPVTGITAVAVVVLGISEPSGKASDTDIK